MAGTDGVGTLVGAGLEDVVAALIDDRLDVAGALADHEHLGIGRTLLECVTHDASPPKNIPPC